VAERARRLALSHLACLGRHTVTGLLCAAGRQFQDWSADYRLLERERVDEEALFTALQRELENSLAPDQPLVAAMDDSILRKRGRRVSGVGWRKDPLGPAFHVNFALGQRVLQISAALPLNEHEARMVPIDFLHAPPAAKPRSNASHEEWQQYHEAAGQTQINVRGVERLRRLRERTPAGRPLWVLVDGRFTNRTVLRNLPPDTVLIGRIRKDAKLHERPGASPGGRGRRRVYGDRLPTPDDLRRDESVPWQSVAVFACGEHFQFHVKTLAPVRWSGAGARDLRLVVIRPLGYRKTRLGKLLYRRPGFLICTDPELPIEKILQAYVWRWDIEVNFRDEKTLLGVGQAQVRTPVAVQKAPAMGVAAYSLLLLAAARAFGAAGRPDQLPPPKWRAPRCDRRASTAELINQLRFEMWGEAIAPDNFSGFSPPASPPTHKPQKIPGALESAIFYAMN